MQTFLPSESFRRSAELLDTRRLGKQRVEALQIARALTWPAYGWKNHPAVAMWRGFTRALVCYGVAVCLEWTARGHRDTVARNLLTFTDGAVPSWTVLRAQGLLPPWLGDQAVHGSHRAALVRKDPAHYAGLFDTRPDAGYVWPPPVFPSWPLRRTNPARPLSPERAVALLGRVDLDSHGWQVVRALHAGEDAELVTCQDVLPVIVASGFATPRLTACYSTGPPLPYEPDDSTATSSRVSSRGDDRVRSTARPPGPAELAATRAEIEDPGEFRFLRRGQPLPPPADRFGLLVLPGSGPFDIPAGARVLRIVRGTGR